MSAMVTDIIDTGTAQIELRVDGIIRITPRSGVHSTLPDSIKMFELIKELSQGRPALILNDFTHSPQISVDRDARQHTASPEVANQVGAFAMLINSPVGRMFGNFWMKVNRPPFKARIFTDEQEAIAWLLSVAGNGARDQYRKR